MKIYSVLVCFSDGRRTYVDVKATCAAIAERRARVTVRAAGMDGEIRYATAMTH